MLKVDDSMTRLHKISQIPTNCQYKDFQLFRRLEKLFVNSCVSPEMLLFCTDTTESTEELNPAPRQHIGDCFEIRHLHREFCDMLCSNEQKILLKVWLYFSGIGNESCLGE